ncbi:hypothetical protein, partial [Staphylococcus aureus]|uniref:hypothetical protein n=1 Tax=Staphylococcus aureus TaxID=1280 RepID=UPI001CB80791
RGRRSVAVDRSCTAVAVARWLQLAAPDRVQKSLFTFAHGDFEAAPLTRALSRLPFEVSRLK